MILEDIALSLTPGLGCKGAVRLLEVFSTAEKIFAASREELVHFAELNPTIADAIVRRVAFAQAERELEHCRRNSIIPIASTDSIYPTLLREIPDYPHVIYVTGDPSALLRRSVSIVGTRRISAYGDRCCNNIVKDLGEKVDDLTIVSGLAFGVDSSAHRAALQYNIPTVAVVANPLPSVTPAQHRGLADEIIERGGAIVSECHSQTKYRSSLYIARNRIVAALSGATIIVETPASGGSMTTASMANSYHRLVMAIPGRISDNNSAGCNMLIRNNRAQIYLSAEGLIREMMWDSKAPTDRVVVESLFSDFTEEQTAIIKCFEAEDSLSIEELCLRSGGNVSTLSVTLTELELLGVVRMLPGSRYELLNAVVAR